MESNAGPDREDLLTDSGYIQAYMATTLKKRHRKKFTEKQKDRKTLQGINNMTQATLPNRFCGLYD